MSQNVKYSVDEFEANLREIEGRSAVAYLKGDKSIGAAAAAAPRKPPPHQRPKRTKAGTRVEAKILP